jgi:hypothetical protein
VFSGVEVSILPEGRIYGHEAIDRNSRPANKVLVIITGGFVVIKGIHVGIFIRSEVRYWGVGLRNQRKSEKVSVQK